MSDTELLGRSLSFPPRVGADGRMVWSSAHDNVRESVRVILLTDPGERSMLSEFGAGLRRFLCEPNVAATHRAIEDAVQQALTRWEPRIKLGPVLVEPMAGDAQAAQVTIQYTLVANRASEQLRLRVQLGSGG